MLITGTIRQRSRVLLWVGSRATFKRPWLMDESSNTNTFNRLQLGRVAGRVCLSRTMPFR